MRQGRAGSIGGKEVLYTRLGIVYLSNTDYSAKYQRISVLACETGEKCKKTTRDTGRGISRGISCVQLSHL